MILEVIIFIISCITVVLTFYRTPKLELSGKYIQLEREIANWLKSPIVAPEDYVESVANDSRWFIDLGAQRTIVGGTQSSIPQIAFPMTTSLGEELN